MSGKQFHWVQLVAPICFILSAGLCRHVLRWLNWLDSFLLFSFGDGSSRVVGLLQHLFSRPVGVCAVASFLVVAFWKTAALIPFCTNFRLHLSYGLDYGRYDLLWF